MKVPSYSIVRDAPQVTRGAVIDDQGGRTEGANIGGGPAGVAANLHLAGRGANGDCSSSTPYASLGHQRLHGRPEAAGRTQ
jgi:hypothetical protein